MKDFSFRGSFAFCPASTQFWIIRREGGGMFCWGEEELMVLLLVCFQKRNNVFFNEHYISKKNQDREVQKQNQTN